MVSPSIWHNRKRSITFVVVCMIILLFLYAQQDKIAASTTYNKFTRPSTTLLQAQGEFWKLLRADLETHGPKVPGLDHVEDTNLNIGFDASSERERPDLLKMAVSQWKGLGEAHSAFVDKIHSREYRLPYEAGSRGIVTTAGGSLLPVALVSIRMLRETGSELPVEVFLSKWSEWDPVICSKLLPSLNARCIVLQDIFDYDRTTRKTGLDKYQYKIMSILFSSFEEVLMLDSDCFPIHKANQLFESEPFTSTGLVLWPDFWYPSESPLFFEIASIQAPNLSERASTEAGEILYSKSKHESSLLLAAYYNYHGPKYYYPLQSQGAPGEGDKETFLWSSVALSEPFYTVKKGVHALGYETKDGDWRGSAMAQFDPIQDHHSDAQEQAAAQEANQIYPRPFFAHVNFPKLDPSQIFDSTSFGVSGPTMDSDGTMRRIWHEDEEAAINFFGFDLERIVWRVVKEISCEYEGQFVSWKGKKDVCKKATEYWNAVFG